MGADDAPLSARTLNINIGILGHVDAGKTSLARALSTTGSTASFDRNPQSKERGITLDLGFSSFLTKLPPQLDGAPYDQMQITLVDCPGHASLIRTVIGGAQIIDMMMLVVDVTKGIQTQTAECLVIGEILNDELVVVLNKVDLLPEASRADKLAKMHARIRKTLAATKFADAPIIALSARPGGGDDKVTPVDAAAQEESGVAELIGRLESMVKLPQRLPDGPLHFAIDHCFAIKGQGTVLTGTVLCGSLKVGQEIDFPELKQQRKIKSMQMFKKPVQSATQGDRLGICVTHLDAGLIERGVACSPGYIQTFTCAIVAVRHIRFYKAACRSRAKFHVTVGHSTVMGTATFFGPPRQSATAAAADGDEKLEAATRALTLSRTPFPDDFDTAREYAYQEELDPEAEEQWALLQLESPVQCELHATTICSHLDSDINLNSCRLAFHGRFVRAISPDELDALRVFKSKRKEGQIERIHDDYTLICKNLFGPGADMSRFFGMSVQVGETGPVGKIDSTFGKTKFKCAFSTSLEAGALTTAVKDCKRIYLNYRRFVFDTKDKRAMVQ